MPTCIADCHGDTYCSTACAIDPRVIRDSEDDRNRITAGQSGLHDSTCKDLVHRVSSNEAKPLNPSSSNQIRSLVPPVYDDIRGRRQIWIGRPESLCAAASKF